MSEYIRIKLPKSAKGNKTIDIEKDCKEIINYTKGNIDKYNNSNTYLVDFSAFYSECMKKSYDYANRFNRKTSAEIYKKLYKDVNKVFNELVFSKLYNDFGQVGLDNAIYMQSIKHIILNNYMRYRLYTLAMIICSNYIHEIESEDFEKLLLNLAYGFKVNHHTVEPDTNMWENLLR